MGLYKNSAVISMVVEDFSALEWTPLEAEQYAQNFLYILMEGMESFLQDEKKGAEIIYLGVGTYCCFLDMSQVVRNSDMRQQLTNVVSACFRICSKQKFSYRICVSSICIGEEGIRQAYRQAREMMKYSFYDDSRILYFDVGKGTSAELPKEAKELLQKAAGFNNWKEKELMDAFQNLWECCQRDKIEGKVLITWLRNLDEEAGFLRPAGEYHGIHTLEQLKASTKSYIHDLQKKQKREIPSGVSGTTKCAVEFIHQNYKNQIGLKDTAAAAGFCDYHYFAKTFKKLNGMSPLDYRNHQD